MNRLESESKKGNYHYQQTECLQR